jgi:hypothetical protein
MYLNDLSNHTEPNHDHLPSIFSIDKKDFPLLQKYLSQNNRFEKLKNSFENCSSILQRMDFLHTLLSTPNRYGQIYEQNKREEKPEEP